MVNSGSNQILAALLAELTPQEGVCTDIVPRVDLFRITQATPRTPQTYEPGIIFLAQGHKRIFIGNEVFTYDPLHYLVLAVPLPLECETNGSSEQPLLGITIKVDPAVVAEIMLAVHEPGVSKKNVPKGIYSAPIEADLTDALIRLLHAIRAESERTFLAPLIVKEILFRVLSSPTGDALRALAYKNQHFFQIARVLDKIHQSYAQKFDLNALAFEAGMSISAFHANFKAVTSSAPLQYIKNIKLQKAKMLIQTEGIKACDAAAHVGYESTSQFNREYKRLFGRSPGRDTAFSVA
ncbi:MAG: AraC family transcriptional regulator [Leptospiraceae bacterium]|nr:AraC family transcriptional regulator [Leptospiraceae bacterium]